MGITLFQVRLYYKQGLIPAVFRLTFLIFASQVTSVGINTEWGLLMASISEDTGEETPLQVSLFKHVLSFPLFFFWVDMDFVRDTDF